MELSGVVDRGKLTRFIADHDAAEEDDCANPDELEAAAKRALDRGNTSPEVQRILEWAEEVRRVLER